MGLATAGDVTIEGEPPDSREFLLVKDNDVSLEKCVEASRDLEPFLEAHPEARGFLVSRVNKADYSGLDGKDIRKRKMEEVSHGVVDLHDLEGIRLDGYCPNCDNYVPLFLHLGEQDLGGDVIDLYGCPECHDTLEKATIGTYQGLRNVPPGTAGE
jgi:hypothetical protein